MSGNPTTEIQRGVVCNPTEAVYPEAVWDMREKRKKRYK